MKISIISYYDVTLPFTGGPVRTSNLAKSLAAQKNDVEIIIPDRTKSSQLKNGILVRKTNGFLPYPFLSFLSRFLAVDNPAALYLYDPSFLLRILSMVLGSDIIQIDAPVPAGAVICLFFAKLLNKVVVVDSHDAFQALRVKISNPLRKMFELFLEKVAYKFSSLVLVVSEFDRNLLVSYGTRNDKIVTIPNGVEISRSSSEHSDIINNRYKPKAFFTVIFVGNMGYLPNEDAANLIVSQLAPQVLSQFPGVRFMLVGKKPDKLPVFDQNVVFTGIVSDVGRLLQDADVAIAPLRHGSGTRLKILEYLSYSLPVVSTSVGVEGLNVKTGVNVLVEDNMENFSLKIIELLQDAKLRQSLGAAGRELVVRDYDWLNYGRKLDSVYSVLSKK